MADSTTIEQTQILQEYVTNFNKKLEESFVPINRIEKFIFKDIKGSFNNFEKYLKSINNTIVKRDISQEKPKWEENFEETIADFKEINNELTQDLSTFTHDFSESFSKMIKDSEELYNIQQKGFDAKDQESWIKNFSGRMGEESSKLLNKSLLKLTQGVGSVFSFKGGELVKKAIGAIGKDIETKIGRVETTQEKRRRDIQISNIVTEENIEAVEELNQDLETAPKVKFKDVDSSKNRILDTNIKEESIENQETSQDYLIKILKETEKTNSILELIFKSQKISDEDEFLRRERYSKNEISSLLIIKDGKEKKPTSEDIKRTGGLLDLITMGRGMAAIGPLLATLAPFLVVAAAAGTAAYFIHEGIKKWDTALEESRKKLEEETKIRAKTLDKITKKLKDYETSFEEIRGESAEKTLEKIKRGELKVEDLREVEQDALEKVVLERKRKQRILTSEQEFKDLPVEKRQKIYKQFRQEWREDPKIRKKYGTFGFSDFAKTKREQYMSKKRQATGRFSNIFLEEIARDIKDIKESPDIRIGQSERSKEIETTKKRIEEEAEQTIINQKQQNELLKQANNQNREIVESLNQIKNKKPIEVTHQQNADIYPTLDSPAVNSNNIQISYSIS